MTKNNISCKEDVTQDKSINDKIMKEFRCGTLFDIRPTKVYKKSNKELYKENGTIPVISNSSMNNGVGGYSDLEPTEKGGIITFSDTTTGPDTLFYQPNDFIGYSHVQGMYPFYKENWNEHTLMYYICALKRASGTSWSYANKFNRKLVAEIKALLPIVVDNENNPILDEECKYHKDGYIPDFDYMRDKVINLEKEIIVDLKKEKTIALEQYLTVAGLDNYELTEKDIKVLCISGFRNFKELGSKDINRTYKEFREFKLDDLFIKKTMKGYPKSKENLIENINGYYIYGQNIKRKYPKKVILDEKYLHIIDPKYPILAYTSSVGEIGMIDESFYRSGENGAFQGLFPKKYIFNRYELQFILSTLKKSFDNFEYSTSMANIMNLSFKLPIQTDEDGCPIIDKTCQYHSEGYIPDWNFMKNYIKAIEKIVIEEVIKQKKLFIEQLKIVVNK